MKIDSVEFGKKLDAELKRRMITVKEFAGMMKLSHVRIHKMLQGEKGRKVYNDTVIRVARTLGVPFDFFVEDEQ